MAVATRGETRERCTWRCDLRQAGPQLGGARTALSDGGTFMHTATPVDLSSFTLFLVGKWSATDGLFYLCYALTSGPVKYMYVAADRTGELSDRITYQADVYRDGYHTSGACLQALDQAGLSHVYTIHYDGTAAGSFLRIDGAIALPDDVPLLGDAGTQAWNAVLYLLSDDGGFGSKAGSLAAARLYPALTLAQIQAVEAELFEKYTELLPDPSLANVGRRASVNPRHPVASASLEGVAHGAGAVAQRRLAPHR